MRPAVNLVVELLTNAVSAARRGHIVAVGIAIVVDTYQTAGMSRARQSIIPLNLLKSACWMLGTWSAPGPWCSLFDRKTWEPPDADCIAVLEDNLVLAQKGKLLGVALAMVSPDNQIWAVQADDRSELVRTIMLGVRAELAHGVTHALSVTPAGPSQQVGMPRGTPPKIGES